MIYACDNCGHIFSCNHKPDQCPHCGKNTVVSTSPTEQGKQEENRETAKKSAALDVSTIRTKVVSSFKFTIHVSELGIASDKIMDIIVKYKEEFSNDHYILCGDAWARQQGDTVYGYIASASLTTKKRILPEEQIKCLLDTTCNSLMFRENLEKYVSTLKHIEQ